MFKFFKKKASTPDLPAILALEDAAFIECITRMIQTGEPAAAAMCIVAHENLRPMLSATFNIAKENPEKGLPATLLEFLYFLSATIETQRDEIGRRRLFWFLQAGLVELATGKALKQREFTDNLANLWIKLIAGSAHLKALLQHNVIWSEEEKIWFSNITDEHSGMMYTLNHIMPKFLQDHPSVEEFCNRHDVYVI